MRAILLNRITIVLSFIGIFIAGTLSLGKLMNVIPPCGAVAAGCLQVETDKSSMWFGIPVAYFGLGAYVTLAALGFIRQRNGLAKSRNLVNIGYGMSAIGMMVSAFLTYYALNEIHATCLWCLSSAATMTALFFTHAVLAQDDLPEEAPTGGFDFKLVSSIAAVTIVGLATMGFKLRAQMSDTGMDGPGGNTYKALAYDKYVPKGAHIQGNNDATITVVEFGDLFCPACRAHYSAIHDEIADSHGKIKFVFRHLPMHTIAGHEFAFSAAILSEIAAENGKFWEFISGAYALQDEPKDLKPFMGVYSNLGLPMKNLEDRLSNDKDPAFQRVYDDMKFAESTGVKGTPAFFILRDGKDPESKTATDLKEWLDSPEAKQYIKQK